MIFITNTNKKDSNQTYENINTGSEVGLPDE